MNFSNGVDTAMDAVHRAYPTVKTYPFRHLDKWQVAATAAANYKRDKYPIILVGHSMGADATFWVAHRLQEQGIPVAAIFSYDPTPLTPCAPSNVQVVVSWRNTVALNLGQGLAHWCFQPPKGSVRSMERYDVHYAHVDVDDLATIHSSTVKHVGDVINMIREMKGKK